MQHPPSLGASAEGKQRIKKARERKEWRTDAEAIDQPLREASKLLDPQNRERWNKKYLDEFIGKNGKPRLYVEGVSPATWKRFLQGKSIKAEIFKAFCQILDLPWQEVAELDDSRLIVVGDPPTLTPFYGRTWYFKTLHKWVVQEQARLIILYGQAGIGKTSLVRQFVEKIRTESATQFDEIIWLSSTSFLPDIFPDQAEISDNSIAILFELLKQQKSLSVLDGWTEILGIEDDTVTYLGQDYNAAKLLHKMRQEILKKENSNCFVLIGGNEKPKSTDEITDEGRSKLFRSIRLEGMGRLREDYDEFNDDKEILTAEDLHGKEGELRAFLTRYSNPSDLKSIAKRARNVFGGEVARFVTQYSALIDANIDNRLKKQWSRLSEVERVLLCWLAVRSELCSFERLEKDLIHCGVQWDTLIETLNSLIEMQALVERDECSEFKVSRIWQKFIIRNMVERASEEISRAIKEDRVQNTELFLSLAFITLDVQDERIKNEQMRRIVVPILNELIAKLQNKSNVQEGLEQILASLKEHENAGAYGIQNVETLLSKLNSR